MRESIRVRYTVVILAIALLATSGVMAQTASGRLQGTVVDNNGEALPGVTVTLQSPELIGGPRTAITDAGGSFSFVALPPGTYSVRSVLDGYMTQERTDVKVNLGGTAIIGIQMPAGKFGGEIEVTAETPVVDPTQVNTEQVFDQSYLKNAAVGSGNRSYQSILGQTAGAVGTGNPSVFGSTLGENVYFIDGMDTTDPVTSTFGTNFNYDAIQEIQFQTSGFEAEYGRATGGFVNLVTKSGGNSFSGTFDIRYRDTSFYENGDHFDKNRNKTESRITGITLGGPIVRDKVWFFVSYQNSHTKLTPANAYTTRLFEGNYYMGKATWQVDPSWRVVVRGSGDPADIDNAYQANRLPEATGFQKQGGHIYTGELNGVLSEALLWNAFVGINRQELNTYPETGDLATPGHYNYDNGLYTDNYMNQQYSNRDRDDYVTSLTYFVDDFGGSHEFKGGIEYSDLSFKTGNCDTGDLVGDKCYAGQVGYRYYDVLFDPADPNSVYPYFLWEDVDAGFATYTGSLKTAYLQDSWRPKSNLTLKLGVRYDGVNYDTDNGKQVADMSKFQPRVGVAWDLTGDSKNVVRANWGRFMHPSALTLPSFAKTQEETSYRWYSCSYIVQYVFGYPAGTPEECASTAAAIGYQWMQDPTGFDPNGFVLSPSQTYGSAPSEIDPNLNPMYADEYSVAYERALWDRSSVEIAYINKKTKDIFEDTCDGNFPTPHEGASCDYYFMYNIPGLRRNWEGVVVRFENRTLDWLTLLASYTYGISKGDIEYTQNGGTDFDVYPWHFVNRYGYLSDGAKNRVKLNGFVLLPMNFTVGFDATYTSGFPYNTLENSSNVDMPYGDYFVEPRGSRNANSTYNLDLEASKGWTLGAVRLELIGTIYNVLSSERATDVCEQYTDGCTTTDKDTTVHVDFGQPITWQTPRRYEVGFRVEF